MSAPNIMCASSASSVACNNLSSCYNIERTQHTVAHGLFIIFMIIQVTPWCFSGPLATRLHRCLFLTANTYVCYDYYDNNNNHLHETRVTHLVTLTDWNWPDIYDLSRPPYTFFTSLPFPFIKFYFAYLKVTSQLQYLRIYNRWWSYFNNCALSTLLESKRSRPWKIRIPASSTIWNLNHQGVNAIH